MSRRYHTHPVSRWRPENWARQWAIRGPRSMEPDAIKRRKEIQAFRLELAKKEPTCP